MTSSSHNIQIYIEISKIFTQKINNMTQLFFNQISQRLHQYYINIINIIPENHSIYIKEFFQTNFVTFNKIKNILEDHYDSCLKLLFPSFEKEIFLQSHSLSQKQNTEIINSLEELNDKFEYFKTSDFFNEINSIKFSYNLIDKANLFINKFNNESGNLLLKYLVTSFDINSSTLLLGLDKNVYNISNNKDKINLDTQFEGYFILTL